MKETKKSKKKELMMILRRVAVVAAFTVAGIIYVSADDSEEVFKRQPSVRAETADKADTIAVSKEPGVIDDRKSPTHAVSVGESAKTAENSPNHQETLTRESVKININKADEQELTTLKGIGPSKAGKIIAFRKEHGTFKSIEELMLVPGIKEGTFSKIKDNITV